MFQYAIRILGAWLLVKVAGGLMKDAERLLKESANSQPLAATDTTANHNGLIEAEEVVVDG